MSDEATIIAAVIAGICTIVAAAMKGREKAYHNSNYQTNSDSPRPSVPPSKPSSMPSSSMPPHVGARRYLRAVTIILITVLISFFIPYPISLFVIIAVAIWQLLTIVKSVKH